MERQVYFFQPVARPIPFRGTGTGRRRPLEPCSVLPFEIRPPWWATLVGAHDWSAFAGLGYVFVVFSYRTAQFLKESKIRAELKRLENAALQAQMNPHFIFNCLNSIQHFILKNDSNAAVLYLAKFAKLVRDTLNASVAGELSLEEEIRMLGRIPGPRTTSIQAII